MNLLRAGQDPDRVFCFLSSPSPSRPCMPTFLSRRWSSTIRKSGPIPTGRTRRWTKWSGAGRPLDLTLHSLICASGRSDLGLQDASPISHRSRHKLTRNLAVHKQTGLVTVPLALQDKPHLPGPATSYTEHAGALAEHYFDFLFQGFPQQCGDEKMCKEFEREFEWAGFM